MGQRETRSDGGTQEVLGKRKKDMMKTWRERERKRESDGRKQ